MDKEYVIAHRPIDAMAKTQFKLYDVVVINEITAAPSLGMARATIPLQYNYEIGYGFAPHSELLAVVTGRIRIRGDNGECVGMGEPEKFLVLNGKYYRLSGITSCPPVLSYQLEIEGEASSAYVCQDPYEATARREQERISYDT